jgi:hypothetical protein
VLHIPKKKNSKVDSQMMCQSWMRSNILENVSPYEMVTHHLGTTFGEKKIEV